MATEAYSNFLGGQNMLRDPSLLPGNQYHLGVNLTCRGGTPHTRPPFIPTTSLPAGKFQGAMTYELEDTHRIVFGVSGHVFILDLSTLNIKDLGKLLNPQADRFFFCQVERYFVVQDGVVGSSWDDTNWPVIIYKSDRYTGQNATRTTAPEDCLPKGAMMAYGQNRLFVATNFIYDKDSLAWSDDLGRTGFVAGDIMDATSPESLLGFTSTNYLTGGRVILPSELGFITGMGFQRNIFSGVGYGSLIVGAKNGMSSYNVESPRAEWTSTDFGNVLFSGIRSTSPHSWSFVNSDIVYRAHDGIRTLRYTSTEARSGSLSNDPISAEVKPVLDLDNLAAQEYTTTAYVDERSFCTTVPSDKTTGAFKALISFDTSPSSTLADSAPPIYDGIWTGLEFNAVVSADYNGYKTLFAFHAGEDDSNELFRLGRNGETDASDLPKTRIYLPVSLFDSPFASKIFIGATLWMVEIKTDLEITGYYRRYGSSKWEQMKKTSIAKAGDGDGCYHGLSIPVYDQHLSGLGNANYKGTAFEVCIEWAGQAKAAKIVLFATDPETLLDEYLEEIEINADDYSDELITLDDYDYEVTI